MVGRLRRPIEIAGRRFVCSCDLQFERDHPERAGVPVRRFVDRLSFVKCKDVWASTSAPGSCRCCPTIST